MPSPRFYPYQRPATNQQADAMAELACVVAFLHRYRVRYGVSTAAALHVLEHQHRDLLDPTTNFADLRAIFVGHSGAV